ncbi:MFS transporter [Jeotgalibacillus proteolyticus]|uniref:MFS transporter n=1 Tax=Jeotgalibacillus proteolyticus TaxID=2082395 RepID=A0A2S5GDF4_9BACL|nr:MFS transporter [Jeotgalibacillus proteolyticus]PPA70988.1 MFS transporter [Jeotgalibacillus proteolyticus]
MGKKSFRFLWIGQTMANAGDILYIVGLISAIYAVTGSALYMALLPFFNMTARMVSALLAPFLLDRVLLQRLLAFSQMGKTAVLFVLVLFLNVFLKDGLLTVLFVFVGLIAFLDGWASPARGALLPRLVEKHELVKANSFIAVIDRTIQLGIWPLGAILVAGFGAAQTVWFTVALYLAASVLMIGLLKTAAIDREETIHEKKFDGFKEGWMTILKTPFLLLISVTELIETAAGVVWIAAIMYIYVAEVLQAGEAWWGYINSSFFAGLLIGGMLGLKFSSVIEARLKLFIIAGGILTAAITLCFALIANPFIALALSMLFGFCSQLKGVAQQTIVQVNVKERLLPKVYSAQEAAYFAVFGLGTLVFGYLTEWGGPRFIFGLSGGLLVVSALLLIVFRAYLHEKALLNE